MIMQFAVFQTLLVDNVRPLQDLNPPDHVI